MTKGKNKEKLKEKSIDIEKYETIFDHNITDEELEYFTPTRSKEEYLKKYNYDQDEFYRDLYDLYCYRGDYTSAKKYFYMQSEKAIKENYNPYTDTFTGDIEIKGVTL